VFPDGVDFGAIDGKPVCLCFLVISPGRAPGEHLQVLASISRWVKGGQHVQALLGLHDARAIYDFLQQEGGAT
jgi:mannitol/fructose-specific phosphotransferase system IIA component (Ntr-type)